MEILRIMAGVLFQIKTAARLSGARECMGLLTSPANAKEITGAYLLDAEASASHAEAAPQALKHAAEDIRQKGLIPRGMWHSHGRHAVFHSSIDDSTICRLLPAMAESNFDYSADLPIPQLLGPTTALLPIANGRQLKFCLTADSDQVAFAPDIAWQGIHIESKDVTEPAAIINADRLELCGGTNLLILGLPKFCRLTSTIEERSGSRRARLYSMVVNERGDAEAKCLVVGEIEADIFMRLTPCEIVSVEEDKTPRAGGFLPLIPFSQAA